ncbi:MAG: ferrochelatase [Terriglobia bacterium]
MAERETSQPKRWGVLLLAHGAPDRLEDIPEFLRHVRHGRTLPEEAVREMVRRYSLIGGGSPLLAWTRRQAEALAARLGCRVYVGMRNWKPFIADAVAELVRDGVERAVVICLAPQNSRTSVGLYRRQLEEAVAQTNGKLGVQFVESWHDHPLLIQAFSEKLRTGLATAEAAAGGRVPVILTAHSVPEKTIAGGDPYDQQVRETAARVAAASKLEVWRLAYQSQGMTAEAWLGPRVEAEIDALAAAGHRHVLIAPIGFICDHVEILYDVDVFFRDYARQRGVSLWRSESLNDSSRLIEALAALALDRIRLSAPA